MPPSSQQAENKQGQGQKRKLFTRKFFIVITIVIAALAITATWILNRQNIIQGPWAANLSIIFSVLGVTFSLCQWLFPISFNEPKLFTTTSSTSPQVIQVTPIPALPLQPVSDDAISDSPPSRSQPDQPVLTQKPPIEPVLARPDSIFPFIVRLPKTSEFFGRVIDRVTLIDRTYIQASTSIVGSRRIGKTWLLQYLMLVARTELGSRFRICYLDATTPSCATVAGFIAEVLKGFGYSNLIAHSDSDLKLLERYVKELRKRNQPPILCIDEFEGLDNEQEFDLNFFRSLRSIAEAGLVLVVASKRPLIEIVGEPGKTSGFFNIFEQLTIEPFNLEEAEAFAKAKGNQAGFTDQERDLLLKYGQTEEQRWPPLRLQLVGKMLLGDKLLGEKEGVRYYSPNDPSYWQKFERRLEDKYRGAVY